MLNIMHPFLLEDLKNEIVNLVLQSELLVLAGSYIHNYKPSRSTLTKHRILKKLRTIRVL